MGSESCQPLCWGRRATPHCGASPTWRWTSGRVPGVDRAMGPVRKPRPRGRTTIVAAAILAALPALALSGAIGSASRPQAARDDFVNREFGFSARLPSGWSRSAERLVPNLGIPREILSAGTFAMPVGGGGNCGREPIVAIDRMRPGDALVSIQEYALSPRMRSGLARTFPALATYSSVGQLRLRRHPRAPGARIPASRALWLWSATLPFRDHGRGFDALVYLKGPRSRERLEQVIAILAGLDFQPGTYLGLPESNPDNRRPS